MGLRSGMWHFNLVIENLPVMLQLALLCALSSHLWTINRTVPVFILALTVYYIPRFLLPLPPFRFDVSPSHHDPRVGVRLHPLNHLVPLYLFSALLQAGPAVSAHCFSGFLFYSKGASA